MGDGPAVGTAAGDAGSGDSASDVNPLLLVVMYKSVIDKLAELLAEPRRHNSAFVEEDAEIAGDSESSRAWFIMSVRLGPLLSSLGGMRSGRSFAPSSSTDLLSCFGGDTSLDAAAVFCDFRGGSE